MTAHELARVLLAGPDVTVVVNARVNELANGHSVRSVKPARMFKAYVGGIWIPVEYGYIGSVKDGATQDVVDLESGSVES